MARELHDHWFRLAKREGYRSRAAYKLMEIDDRRRLLRRGDRVLDLGAAPGSWLQVIAARVGPGGRVVGIDLSAVDPAGLPPNVQILCGDAAATSVADFTAALTGRHAAAETGDGTHPAPPPFDVVLSDMAPKTTGDRTIDHHGSIRLCMLALDLVPALLRPGGHAVVKVLEGEAYPDLQARARTMFARVKGFKPKASRSISTEIYLVMEDRGADLATDVATAPADRPAAPPTRPRGWGAERG